MDCPRHSGVKMEEYEGEGGLVLLKCEECGGLWLDSGDLTRALLHHQLPMLDALGGQENLGEVAGTCPDDLADLTVIEARKNTEVAFALCEICGGVFLTGGEEGFAGDNGDDLERSVVGFFREFAETAK